MPIDPDRNAYRISKRICNINSLSSDLEQVTTKLTIAQMKINATNDYGTAYYLSRQALKHMQNLGLN